jgi:hypothetical protein
VKRRLAVLILAAVLASCGGGQTTSELEPLRGMPVTTVATPPSNSTQVNSPPRSTGDEPIIDEFEGVVVTLHDDGAEPRWQLRLQPEVGSVQRVSIRMDMTQNMSGLRVPTPIFELDQAKTVTAVADGHFTIEDAPYDFRIVDDRGVDPTTIREIETSLDMLVSLGATTIVLSDRGHTISQTVMGEGALYGLGADASDASVVLPLEPVGVGARWRIEATRTTDAGVQGRAITELELVEIHDDRVVARYTESITFLPGILNDTQGRGEVLGGEHSFSGTVTWLLRTGTTLIDSTGGGEIRMRFLQGQNSSRMRVAQEIAVTMRIRD